MVSLVKDFLLGSTLVMFQVSDFLVHHSTDWNVIVEIDLVSHSKVGHHHTFGTHPEQPLPTGYKGIPFIIG